MYKLQLMHILPFILCVHPSVCVFLPLSVGIARGAEGSIGPGAVEAAHAAPRGVPHPVGGSHQESSFLHICHRCKNNVNAH